MEGGEEMTAQQVQQQVPTPPGSDVGRGSDRGRRAPSPPGDSRVSNQGSDNQGVWADVEPRQRRGARSGEPRPAAGEPRQSSGRRTDLTVGCQAEVEIG
eukprot:3217154-Karenia_brevis.AAC.1